MKRTAFFLAMICAPAFFIGCIAKGDTATVKMSARPGIAISEKAETPAVHPHPLFSFPVEFGAPVEPAAASGEIRLYRVTADGAAIEEDCSITSGAASTSGVTLLVSRRDGAAFVPGEEYRIVAGTGVRSKDGLSPASGFTGYFAVSYPFSPGAGGVEGMNGARTAIVCVSDIHMGANAGSATNYALIDSNKAKFADFLEKIRVSPNVRELVIGGDLFDEWFVPMAVDTFAGKTQADFAKAIAANNAEVISALNRIITEGNIKVTFVPGNHDLLFTAAEIEAVLPGISQARDARGLGAYAPSGRPELVVEHGHRYNFFCAPDPVSNRSITKSESLLPPAYFTTRVEATSLVEGRPPAGGRIAEVTLGPAASVSQKLFYGYWIGWKSLMAAYPIREGFDEKIIKTNIDGYTETYSLADLIPYQASPGGEIVAKLYSGIQDTWDQRQTANLVPVKIPVFEALTRSAMASETDAQAAKQYFTNPDANSSKKRIVIFGHTHQATLAASSNSGGQKTIYANTGTWIDDSGSRPSMTFVTIVPPKAGGAGIEFVGVHKYSGDGATVIASDAISISGQ